jgi:hypothetical protein
MAEMMAMRKHRSREKTEMQRRRFLKAIAASGLSSIGYRWTCPAVAAPVTADMPFLLSEQGCGRATGYAEANKIVTVGDKTHVAWLDSPPEGFRVRIRTLDRRTGQWSPTYTVGEAYDNHGGPALSVDSQGFLHIVYYPHHHPFRYRKSRRPNDASEWEEEVQFGERCTYPTLVCGPDNTLYFTCRRSYSDKPWHVELWTKRPDGDWEGPIPIARSRHPGYAHFQESLAWGPDRRLLHLCCRFHEKTDKAGYGRIQTVAYMVSDDYGQTWRRPDGSAIELPATAETVERLASGGVDHGRELRAGGMTVDAAGKPHLVYSVGEGGRSKSVLATLENDGTWRRRELNAHLPNRWKDWDLTMAGGVTFNECGEMTITAQVKKIRDSESSWGHATNEVVRFRSTDGGDTFQFAVVSKPDPQTSHWLPNIERATGHNQVPDRPSILYTAGPPGQKNTDLLSNRVYIG